MEDGVVAESEEETEYLIIKLRGYKFPSSQIPKGTNEFSVSSLRDWDDDTDPLAGPFISRDQLVTIHSKHY